MWRISDLKQRGKTMFHLNYWRTVLVAFVLAVLVGAGASSSSGSIGSQIGQRIAENNNSSYSVQDVSPYYFNDYGDIDDDFYIGGYDGDIDMYIDNNYSPLDLFGDILFISAIVMAIVVVILIAVIILDIVIFNPLEVGSRRFFYRNLYEKAEVKEVMYGFDHNYKNVVKVMFFRDLYTILWTCLFIIPGFVKSYEYSMVPYLLAEYPDMPKEDAFAISRYMMDGNKWHAFLMDLSFIGWRILAAIPFVGTFYVNPYYYMTHAALYDTLKEKKRPFASAEDASAFTDAYGDAGTYGSTDSYGDAGTYGSTDSYGDAGTYGSADSYGENGTYGNSDRNSDMSEY